MKIFRSAENEGTDDLRQHLHRLMVACPPLNNDGTKETICNRFFKILIMRKTYVSEKHRCLSSGGRVKNKPKLSDIVQ